MSRRKRTSARRTWTANAIGSLNRSINRSLEQLAARYPVRNTPDPRKIAVFSALWSPNHSVYRIASQYVRALRGKYHLTFYQLGGFGLTH